ncbi:MAG: Synerg-CTERM sorting domain-containing protein, partial [Cloacibacillus sp.]
NITAQSGFAISGSGNKWNGGTNITISSGILESKAAPVIYHPQDGILNISGGTLTGPSGIEIKAGTINMTGGIITANGTPESPGAVNNNGSSNAGSGIAALSNSAYTGDISLNISGGTIKSINGTSLFAYLSGSKTSQIKGIAVSGGTFSAKIVSLNIEDGAKAKTAVTGGSYSSNPKEYVGPGYAVAKHGDMFVVEIPAPAPTSPDLPADKPKEVQPVTPVVASVDITATAEDKAKTVSDAASYADKGTITAADLEVSPQGFVVPKEAVVQAAFADAMQKSNKEGSITEVNVLPVFSATLATSGDVAAISYSVKGSDLKAAKAGDVRVIKVLSSTTGDFFTFQSDSSKTADKNFALQPEGDKKFLAAADAIAADKNYKLLLFVKDNGDFDLCKDDKGKVVDPAAIAKTTEKAVPTPTPTPTPAGGSSSSGCNAGVAALALLGFALVPVLYRKKR